MATHLVWFRNDLRVTDNLALHHACQDPDATVIAIYIATPKQWQQHDMSPRQAWFIHQHLAELQNQLSKLNIPLLYQETGTFDDAVSIIQSTCQQYQITDLFYNKQYEWNEVQRDKAIARQLADSTIALHGYDDSVLSAPGTIVNGSGKMYQVYTPFRNKYCDYLRHQPIEVYPKPKKRVQSVKVDSDTIKPFSYPCQKTDHFVIGETQAIKCLQRFCQEQVDDYLKQRDIPFLDSTSRLSAYLTIGVLSPRQCFARLKLEYPEFLDVTSSGAFGWFNQLIWREFYRHLLFLFPKLSKNKPYIDWTQRIKWRNDKTDFTAWQKGLTGYPIVDAAMRQLNQTGWMHNRLRLIVSSFLVKDLMLDWRWGERYFMSQLIDGDLAANNGGWQWSASTGTDAAPYFRIFNPSSQSKRFDPDGKFIRQYLPELADIPDDAMSDPHRWAKQNNVKLDYPEPIVEHNKARQYTLAAFNAAK